MKATLAFAMVGAFGTFAAAQTGIVVVPGPGSPMPSGQSLPAPSNAPQGISPVPISGPLPTAGPVGAPVPVPVPIPASLPSNGPTGVPASAPQGPSSGPSTGSGSPQGPSSGGVTVRIVPGPDGGGVPVVVTANGPEPVQLVAGPNGNPVIPGPNGLIPVAAIIGPNGQPLEPVDLPSGAAAPGSVPTGAVSNVPQTGSGSGPGPFPAPVSPSTLNNPNAIPEPVASGAYPAPSNGAFPTPVAGGQGQIPGGYYNSGASSSVEAVATFALVMCGVAALLV